MAERGRNHALSYLRAVACIAIIVLHVVNVAVILHQDEISAGQYAAGMGVVGCMMWAVPCFVMVSGFLLLDPKREITLEKIFKKYVFRVLAALFACGIIFRVFEMIMDQEAASAGGVFLGIREILTGESWSHLWYLYLLIGLYLLLPFYRMAAAHSDKKLLRYLLAVYFVFLSVLPMAEMAGTEIGFYIHVSTIYPFYFFAGYAIGNGIWRPKRITAVLMIAAGAAGLVIATGIRYMADLEEVSVLLGYPSVFVVLLSVGLFTLFTGARQGGDGQRMPAWLSKALLALDRDSFGIYLLHLIFVRLVLRYWGVDPFQLGAWVCIPVVAGILAASWVLVWLLKKIPGVRRIL